jgi:hypothetical protein
VSLTTNAMVVMVVMTCMAECDHVRFAHARTHARTHTYTHSNLPVGSQANNRASTQEAGSGYVWPPSPLRPRSLARSLRALICLLRVRVLS